MKVHDSASSSNYYEKWLKRIFESRGGLMCWQVVLPESE